MVPEDDALPLIKLYGKPGCGKCESAEDKVQRLGFTYSKGSIEDVVSGLVRDTEALTQYAMQDGDLPVFVINGQGYTYPEAMKWMKNFKK